MAKARKLAKNERHQNILDEARTSASIRISALAGRLGVTTETVRRDIRELSDAGLINRIYGGATAQTSALTATATQAGSDNGNEATAIGDAAAQRVRPGQTVMLSGGAIAIRIASILARSSVNLVIVTNNARIAAVAGSNPTIQTILSPGTYDARDDCVTGEDTVGYLEQFNADIAIVQSTALTAEGPSEATPATAAVKRAMLRYAAEKILVLESSGWSRRAAMRICPLCFLDEIVISATPTQDFADASKRARTKLSIV